MNKELKTIFLILLIAVTFIFGAAAGGCYTLRHLEIEENAESYFIIYEGHLFEYGKEN